MTRVGRSLILLGLTGAACQSYEAIELPDIGDAQVMIVFAEAGDGVRAAVFVPGRRPDEATLASLAVFGANEPHYTAVFYKQPATFFGFVPGPLEAEPCGESSQIVASSGSTYATRGADGDWQTIDYDAVSPSIRRDFCARRQFSGECGQTIVALELDCPAPVGSDEADQVMFAFVHDGTPYVATLHGCVFSLAPLPPVVEPSLTTAFEAVHFTSGWHYSPLSNGHLFMGAPGAELVDFDFARGRVTRVIPPTPGWPQIVALDGDDNNAQEIVATTFEGGLLHYVKSGQSCAGECLGDPAFLSTRMCRGWCVREEIAAKEVESPRITWVALGDAYLTTTEPHVVHLQNGVITHEPIPAGLAATSVDFVGGGFRVAAVASGGSGRLLDPDGNGGWIERRLLPGHVQNMIDVTLIEGSADVPELTDIAVVGERGLFALANTNCAPQMLGAVELSFVQRCGTNGTVITGGHAYTPGQPLQVWLMDVRR